MKKINFKKPKYILPLIILIPIIFILYNVSSLFAGDSNKDVVSDSLITNLPDNESVPLKDKMAEFDKNMAGAEDYSAIMGVDFKEDTTINRSIYKESEMDSIDYYQSILKKQLEEEENRRKQKIEEAKHYNKYIGQVSSSNYNSQSDYSNQSDDMYSYTQTLNELKKINANAYPEDNNEDETLNSISVSKRNKINKADSISLIPKVVEKINDVNEQYFNTVKEEDNVDAPLIKAIIDQSIKAKAGTRLRFKLLDAVRVQGITLPKNTYLYGKVTGFQDQRVLADITNILYKNKFIHVNLSVYDIDGMAGFYVPKSVFREFLKQATSESVNNINYTTNQSTEGIALQALQNMYQSATQAIGANIRRQKAQIKYNTTVYLINTTNN